MRTLLVTLCLGALGCNGGDDKDTAPPADTDTDTDTDSDTDTDTDSDADTDADTDTDADADTDADTDTDTDTDTMPTDDWPYPEPFDGLVYEDACTKFGGVHPVPGATTYYVGDLDISGPDLDTVSGTEWWVLFANPWWVDAGGYDCSIPWTVTGTKSPSGSASSYDLNLHLEIDVASADCPAALVASTDADAGIQDTTYKVTVNGDGTTSVTFVSGTAFAEGYATDGRTTYASAYACSWF